MAIRTLPRWGALVGLWGVFVRGGLRKIRVTARTDISTVSLSHFQFSAHTPYTAHVAVSGFEASQHCITEAADLTYIVLYGLGKVLWGCVCVARNTVQSYTG